jgi:hypothetical protein
MPPAPATGQVAQGSLRERGDLRHKSSVEPLSGGKQSDSIFKSQPRAAGLHGKTRRRVRITSNRVNISQSYAKSHWRIAADGLSQAAHAAWPGSKD